MKKKIFLIWLCFIATFSMAQSDSTDFINRWQSLILTSQVTPSEFDSLKTSYLNSISEDSITHAQKLLNRNLYWFQDRTSTDSLGKISIQPYRTALSNYFQSSFYCNNVGSNLGINWEVFGPTGNQQSKHMMGHVSAVWMNPNNHDEITIGTNSSGIWHTSNHGENWTNVTAFAANMPPVLGINNFAINPLNYDEIYASTGLDSDYLNKIGVGLLKSSDGGATWSIVDIPQLNIAFPYVRKVVYSEESGNPIYLTGENKILKSTGGVSWTQLSTSDLLLDDLRSIVDISVGSTGRIFVVIDNLWGDDELWFSDNQGLTWNYINPNNVSSGLLFESPYYFGKEFINSDGPAVSWGVWSPTGSWDVPEDDWGNACPGGVCSHPTAVQTVVCNDAPVNSLTRLFTANEYSEVAGRVESSIISSIVKLSLTARIPANMKVDFYFLDEDETTYHVFTHNYSSIPTNYEEVSLLEMLTTPDFKAKFAKITVQSNTSYNPSVDGEIWFQRIALKRTSFSLVKLFQNPIDSDDLIIGIEGGFSRFLYSSADGGLNFSSPYYQSRNTFRNKFEVVKSVKNAAEYYVGDIDFVKAYSTGSSPIWGYSTTHPDDDNVHMDVRAIQVIYDETTDEDIIICGNDGGLSISYNSSENWHSLNNDLANSDIYSIDIFDGSSYLLGGFQDNGSLYYDGSQWDHVVNGDGSVSYIHPDDASKWIAGDPQVANFLTDGPGWDLNNLNPFSIKNGFLGMPLESSFSNPNQIYYGMAKNPDDGFSAKMFSYNALTDTYFKVYLEDNITTFFRSIGVSESSPNVVFVGTENNRNDYDDGYLYKLYYSTDYGQSYLPLMQDNPNILSNSGSSSTLASIVFKGRIIRDIQVHPDNHQTVYLAINGIVKDNDDDPVDERWRVIKITNTLNPTSSTWQDYSTGLPGLPVNTILYVNGYNDLLFCGTDAGVYYRNGDMDSWECFNTGLPMAIITDLEFDYCTKELYASTFGHSVWKVKIPFDLTGEEEEQLIISTNTTWNSDMELRQSVRVKSGKTLTINSGVTIDLLTDKKIIVEPGAKLEVKGGILTNSCAGFWGGIEVWGDSDAPQHSATHGQVILSNGSIIEHAATGITNRDGDTWDKNGGIIECYNANFINCKRAVGFSGYQNFNAVSGDLISDHSKFIDCVFKWDDNYRAEAPLGAMVTLFNVYGIPFTGCDFMDLRTENDNGIGIYSLDAQYRVVGRCTDPSGSTCGDDVYDSGWDATNFVGMKTGIKAANSFTLKTVAIDHCIFTNNQTGVEIQSMDDFQVSRNQFLWTDTDGSFCTGLAMTDVNGATIQENSFEFTGYPSDGIVGIFSTDLGEENLEIYNNTFKNLTSGNTAMGSNRSTISSATEYPGKSGLHFICNANQNNEYDHFVAGSVLGSPSSFYGVKRENGSPSYLSGNSFTNPVDVAMNGHYTYTMNIADEVDYYHHSSNTPMEYINVNPLTNLEWSPNSCASKLGQSQHVFIVGLTQLVDYNGKMVAYKDSLATTTNTYQSNQLSPAQTSYLLGLIDNITAQNNAQVKSELENFSPFLTHEILYDLGDVSTQLFSHVWYRDIILLNIELADDAAFRDYLAQKADPLPNTYINQINTSRATTQTARGQLESQMAFYKSRVDYYAGSLLTHYKNDTDKVQMDSILYFYGERQNYFLDYRIIDGQLQLKNYAGAASEINDLGNAMNSYAQHHQQQVQDYVAFKTFLRHTLMQDSLIDDLDSTGLDSLRNFAYQGTGKAALQAQHILCFFYGECTPLDIYMPQSSRAPEINQSPSSENIEPGFKMYPNPANDWVTIQLNGTFKAGTELIITDISGKLVEQTFLSTGTFNWNTYNVERGIYLVTIKASDGTIETQKLILN